MNSLRTLEQVEADVRTLSPQEQAHLRALLEDLLEDRLELTDSFKAEIEAGKRDIAEGRVRIRRP
jgi:predicted transcriptional regulator